jgi:hypothetical protein
MAGSKGRTDVFHDNILWLVVESVSQKAISILGSHEPSGRGHTPLTRQG